MDYRRKENKKQWKKKKKTKRKGKNRRRTGAITEAILTVGLYFLHEN